jgi:hypothetical protein
MKSFHQFISEIKTISYKMAKPQLGLPKGKAYAKRSASSAGGNSGNGDGGDGGGGDGGDGD